MSKLYEVLRQFVPKKTDPLAMASRQHQRGGESGIRPNMAREVHTLTRKDRGE